MTSQIHRHFKVFLLSLGKAWERPIKRALNVVQHRWTPCHFYSPNAHLQLRFRHGFNGSQELRRDATRLQRTECFKRNILYFLDAHLTKPIQVSTCTVNPGLTRHSDKWVIVTINIGTLHMKKNRALSIYQFWVNIAVSIDINSFDQTFPPVWEQGNRRKSLVPFVAWRSGGFWPAFYKMLWEWLIEMQWNRANQTLGRQAQTWQ